MPILEFDNLISYLQKAMDIYKRQKVGLSLSMANGGTIDAIPSSKMGELAPSNDVDIAEEPVLDHIAEMSDVQMLNLDGEQVEVHASVANEEENSEVAGSAEVDVMAHSPNLKLESVSQALSNDIPEKQPMIIFSDGKVDGMSGLVNAEDKQGDILSAPDDVPNADLILATTDGQNKDENGEIEGSDTFNCGEGGQGVRDGICGRVLYSDGSPKAYGALMPGSNESESVILSRIHHSPESTH